MRRGTAPLWLMGLTNAVFGMYGGVVLIALPQILSSRHVPETTIAAMTALMVSPGFWTFIVCPVLDVRFSRRGYSWVTAAVAAALLVIAVLNLDDLILVQWLLVAGYFFVNLYQSALGGWLSSIATAEEQSTLSSWVTIGNLAGGGTMAVVTGALLRNLPPAAAATLLWVMVILPTAVFPFMPAPGPDRKLARDSFAQFFGEVRTLVKRREVLLAIALFAAPAATFSLTNFLGGLGEDFHASAQFVGNIAGGGVLLGGIVGCLLFRVIDRWLPLRWLYLAIGALGALFTFATLLVPRTPAAFAAAFIGENIFQGLSITTSIAITFETIGRRNPLAATTFCLLVSAFNIPITYMLLVDGWGYGHAGVAGSFIADAGVSLVAVVLMGALLVWSGRGRAAQRAAVTLS